MSDTGRYLNISIITAVYNGAATIRDCIESVRSQRHRVEHIIIDGGSTDGTREIIESYRHCLARVVSEPDRGIFDAMNKGIALATGEVIGILNADDFYVRPEVLAKVAGVFADKNIDSCYGDLVYIDPADPGRVIRYWRSGSYHDRRFYQGWMPPHPTFFVRKEVYEAFGKFNPALGSAADYELMLRFLAKHRVSTAYIPEVLVKMRTGGMSNFSLKNRLRANRMDRMAWRVNRLKPLPWTIMMKPISKIPQYFRKP